MTAFTIEKTLTPGCVEDITSSPHYLAELDLKKSLLTLIVAVYAFSEQSIQCSIKGCSKNHNKGHLAITSNEAEVCLCEECGTKYFATTFEQQERKCATQDRHRDQKIRLNKILEQEEAIKERIKTIKQAPYGANWLYRSLENFRKGYPADLLAALQTLASNKDDNEIVDKLLETESESVIAQIEQLQGLAIFATDIREALIGDILKPLKRLIDIAQDPTSHPSLTAFCKWADKLEDHFAQAELLVEQGHIFFTNENLKQLNSIPVSEKSAKRIKSLRWDCETGTLKGKK